MDVPELRTPIDHRKRPTGRVSLGGGTSIGHAREIARRWVETEARQQPGFVGAFLSGSAAHLPDDAILAGTSDIDIKLVLERPETTSDSLKVRIDGVVLDISWASLGDVASADTVLGTYYLAGHLATASILADPSGHLESIQPDVARGFAQQQWVRARVEHALTYPSMVLGGIDPAAMPPHIIVKTWLLALCVMTHPILVADLQNPTIRKCLIASGDTLTTCGHQGLHDRMLELLGSARMDRERVEELFTACTAAFDAAREVIVTPFPHSTNISEVGRPMAIGGIREMIDTGHHREAVFWIGEIHSWCHEAIVNDAPADIEARHAPAYTDLLTALGLATPADFQDRIAATRALLPEIRSAAEDILDRNPRIGR